MTQAFISEDDLKTFDGWFKYQGFDPSTATPEELETWRRMFEDARNRTKATPKVGLMKLQPVPGEYRYAVALREGSDLWLALWVRRSRKGEFFVLLPRGDRDWDVHSSYHLGGAVHMKSFGRKTLESTKRQNLTNTFRGTESLGVYAGFGPKGVGAICDPTAFAGVVEVGPGVLGPRDGFVTVDLVAPGCEPMKNPWSKIVHRQVFSDFVPNIIIAVGSHLD
jgi:hypothetical protein